MSRPRMPADTPDAGDTGDPALDTAWRAHLRDEPPPALDDAILAAAHRAVGSAPHTIASAARWRAWVPLATAATLAVLAFGVVELLPRDADTPAVTSEVPASAVTSDAPASAVTSEVTAGAMTAPPAGAESKVRGDAAPAARSPRQEAPAREAGQAREARQAPGAAQKREARGDGAGAATMQDRASPERAARTARDYVDEITRLRAQGDEQAAIGALHAFRAAYADADARLPEPLRQWAAGVPR
jgi:hypothetical protein